MEWINEVKNEDFSSTDEPTTYCGGILIAGGVLVGGAVACSTAGMLCSSLCVVQW